MVVVVVVTWVLWVAEPLDDVCDQEVDLSTEDLSTKDLSTKDLSTLFDQEVDLSTKPLS